MKYNLKILIHLTFCEYELIVIFLVLRHFKCLGLMENHVLLNGKTSVWRPRVMLVLRRCHISYQTALNLAKVFSQKHLIFPNTG